MRKNTFYILISKIEFQKNILYHLSLETEYKNVDFINKKTYQE